MAMGRGGAKRGGARGWDLRPHPAWLSPFPIPGQTTLPHPRPLKPHGDPPRLALNTIIYINKFFATII